MIDLLTDYEALPIFAGFKFFTSTFEDKQSLASYDLTKLKGENLSRVISRLSEGKSGGPMGLHNLCSVVQLSIGMDLKMHPVVSVPFRFLKYCCNTWEKLAVGLTDDTSDAVDECDDKPGGKLRVKVDSMSPKVTWMCINTAFYLSNNVWIIDHYKNIDWVKLVHQHLSYMKSDPIGNAIAIKGVFANMYQHAGAISSKGYYCVLPDSESWNTYSLVDAPSVPLNQVFWRDLFGDIYAKDYKKLMDLGLTELAKLQRFVITIPSGRNGNCMMRFISGLRACFSGYTDTEPNLAYSDIYDHKKDHPIYKDVGLPDTDAKHSDGSYVMPHIPYLERMVVDTFERRFRSGYRFSVPSWETYLDELPRTLTQNSAGDGKIVISGKIDGKPISIGTTSKAVIGLLSLDSFRPKRSTPRGSLTQSEIDSMYRWYSDEYPGAHAGRVVTVKPRRPIEMQRLPQYLIEAYIGRAWYREMMHKNMANEYVYNGYPMQMIEGKMVVDNNVFTIGAETGQVDIDHSYAILNTGRSVLTGVGGTRVLYYGTDYSSFDQTQTTQNLKKPLARGIIQAFKNVYGDQPVGPFPTIESMIDIIYPEKDARFALPNGENISLNSVRSGEYTTMSQNNTTNISVCMAVTHWLQQLMGTKFLRLRIQGDDVLASVIIPDEGFAFNDLSGTPIGDKIMEAIDGFGVVPSLIKVITLIVNMCGLETNTDKGGVGFDTMEYLKILVKRGYYIPNNYIQPIGAESVAMADDPSGFVTGQLQKVDLAVSRGWDPNIMYRYGILLSMLRYSYRVSVFPSPPDYGYYYYPPWIAFGSPTSMNGLGRAFGIFPCDAGPAIIYCMGFNTILAEYIRERCAFFKPPGGKDYAKVVADLIMSGDKRQDFTVQSKLRSTTIISADLAKPFSSGVRDASASLDVSAIKRSRTAYERLKSKGINLVNSQQLYEYSPKQMIKGVLQANKDVMEFAASMRRNINPDTFNDVKRPSLDQTATFLQSFTINLVPMGKLEYDENGPLCYLHPTMARKISMLPWGCSSKQAVTSVSRILNLLKTDPILPRYWTEEALSRLIFNQSTMEDPNVLSDVLFSIGCSADTVADVITSFSTDSARDAMLQFVSGSFTLNSPIFQMLDRSKTACLPYIKDVAGRKESRVVFPAMYIILAYFRVGGDMDVGIEYDMGIHSESMSRGSDMSSLIPYVPLLESNRLKTEQQTKFTMPG
jgi:hypothetical protein